MGGKKDEGSLGGKLVKGAAKGAAKGTGKLAVGTTKVAANASMGLAGGLAEGTMGAVRGSDSEDDSETDDDEELVVPDYEEQQQSSDSEEPPVSPAPKINVGGVELDRHVFLGGTFAVVVLAFVVGATFVVLSNFTA
jgi:hypothetical protein